MGIDLTQPTTTHSGRIGYEHGFGWREITFPVF
jgi:hypothetical protein